MLIYNLLHFKNIYSRREGLIIFIQSTRRSLGQKLGTAQLKVGREGTACPSFSGKECLLCAASPHLRQHQPWHSSVTCSQGRANRRLQPLCNVLAHRAGTHIHPGLEVDPSSPVSGQHCFMRGKGIIAYVLCAHHRAPDGLLDVMRRQQYTLSCTGRL